MYIEVMQKVSLLIMWEAIHAAECSPLPYEVALPSYEEIFTARDELILFPDRTKKS